MHSYYVRLEINPIRPVALLSLSLSLLEEDLKKLVSIKLITNTTVNFLCHGYKCVYVCVWLFWRGADISQILTTIVRLGLCKAFSSRETAF